MEILRLVSEPASLTQDAHEVFRALLTIRRYELCAKSHALVEYNEDGQQEPDSKVLDLPGVLDGHSPIWYYSQEVQSVYVTRS